MKKNLKFIAPLLLMSLVSLSLAKVNDLQRREMLNDALERRVSLDRLNEITKTDALTRALGEAQVPGGVVTILNCNRAAKHTLTPTGSSLRDVLNSVVSVEPQYKWQVKAGVVNVVPAAGGPSLLNLRIGQFKVDNAQTIYEALNQLFAMPEVQARMTELKMRRGMTQLGIMPAQLGADGEAVANSQSISIERQNITLAEALNAIVSAHGKAVWSYTEQHCDGQNEFSIDFPVR
jgi:hypothetical protein